MKNNLRVAIWKKHLIVLLALIMIFALTACSEEESISSGNSPSPTSTPTSVETVSNDTQWSVYWYLCGSEPITPPPPMILWS